MQGSSSTDSSFCEDIVHNKMIPTYICRGDSDTDRGCRGNKSRRCPVVFEEPLVEVEESLVEVRSAQEVSSRTHGPRGHQYSIQSDTSPAYPFEVPRLPWHLNGVCSNAAASSWPFLLKLQQPCKGDNFKGDDDRRGGRRRAAGGPGCDRKLPGP